MVGSGSGLSRILARGTVPSKGRAFENRRNWGRESAGRASGFGRKGPSDETAHRDGAEGAVGARKNFGGRRVPCEGQAVHPSGDHLLMGNNGVRACVFVPDSGLGIGGSGSGEVLS